MQKDKKNKSYFSIIGRQREESNDINDSLENPFKHK